MGTGPWDGNVLQTQWSSMEGKVPGNQKKKTFNNLKLVRFVGHAAANEAVVPSKWRVKEACFNKKVNPSVCDTKMTAVLPVLTVWAMSEFRCL